MYKEHVLQRYCFTKLQGKCGLLALPWRPNSTAASKSWRPWIHLAPEWPWLWSLWMPRSVHMHLFTVYTLCVCMFFFCVPSYICEGHHFRWDFPMWPFFWGSYIVFSWMVHAGYSICEGQILGFSHVTVFQSNHRGSYIGNMLGMFLLPAFTCLGHKRQDLLSPCDGTHACTDYTLLCTLIWEFLGNGVRTHANSKGNPLSPRLRGRSNPWRCIMQDSEPNPLPTKLFQPLCVYFVHLPI